MPHHLPQVSIYHGCLVWLFSLKVVWHSSSLWVVFEIPHFLLLAILTQIVNLCLKSKYTDFHYRPVYVIPIFERTMVDVSVLHLSKTQWFIWIHFHFTWTNGLAIRCREQGTITQFTRTPGYVCIFPELPGTLASYPILPCIALAGCLLSSPQSFTRLHRSESS